MTVRKSIEEMGTEELVFEIVDYESLIRSCVMFKHYVSNITIENHCVDLGVGTDIIMFLNDLQNNYRERMIELELVQAEREQQLLS